MKFKKFILTSFLLYFVSISFIYAECSSKNDIDYLIPLGNITQIDAELELLMVRNTFKDSPFKVGDSLVSVNETKINNYEDFSNLIQSLNNSSIIKVKILRGSDIISLDVSKDILEKINFNNLISGFATLTYINPKDNSFGAVAHPISVGSNRSLSVKNGSISSTYNLTINKSYKGSVGSINANKNEFIGNFRDNTNFGIKGTINNTNLSKLKKYKVAKLNEVKPGKASILLQTSNNSVKEYDINIINIKNQKIPEAKTFKIEILDKELLSITGGIVQGMSGTPIIQDNKIIGAVSHAIENDPTMGYGVYIGWMLEGE
ncbi:SpoIVB peptidase S55 domain-containing protein [Paraclostridium sordellii]|uniref:Stage IV sporulation protein SpoIVB n=1 Tax=Paraclostridium sordellii TaxID=1505 RepID=A0A0C7Q4J1_PARSO|nr:SpoIVB peptidase S55 domain-containing protein [Paeniclostridium sordellii]CEO14206.1 stage IV sporulation protein SpoIVB [[Clostridium] sordellii] [Paeniclostridium sordellii]CEP89440.1 stage IV sporulation protein SpoIVB [[Clostridium] sordellii] [Paeniclostridium sordellii]CEP98061.1 stage IV sporulation protein SpoIVB [[Clostridium] sordellii] [Paeniclostridium sordellii]CEQ01452.1 stage IV sporulation protein SpoIVB [[Clostridium] sordellii] [Paeniclostridium sordellii]CEQ05158.1 stage